MPFASPDSLDEALELYANGSWRLLAGGSDLFAQVDLRPTTVGWLSLSEIPELKGISERGEHIEIGALTTWAEIERSPLVPAMLAEAAASIGSHQIRWRATIGGNICNAAPIADGLPALFALNANVTLASIHGIRILPIDEFVLGRRTTALHADEVLISIGFRRASVNEGSIYRKFSNREGVTLAITSLAMKIDWREDVADDIRVVVGGASEAPRHLQSLEACLPGRSVRDLEHALADAQWAQELSPIDDLRGTKAFRLHIAGVLLHQSLSDLIAKRERHMS
ncbi:xanthine dehydrogenase family protein subunit M [Burkholderia sp. BCC1977]|uniref:FAD binding domain-containing protein n=1 Tax=Burkholderia sp. BCC1977 TaxID=2817440 RepID=UPI002ABE3120|nr:xanthine dehydrogenase family protein subunit M [Burkholderia sp. BCC1977]